MNSFRGLTAVRCWRCKKPHAGWTPGVRCACGQPLELDSDAVTLQDIESSLQLPRTGSIWDWASVLPVMNPKDRVSLGEAWTPLLSSPRVASEYGLESLYIKAEYQTPTGSLKDRSISVAISHARSVGARATALASTGNQAASVAAYAAAAGLRSLVFVPRGIDLNKIRQTMAYGAQIVRVDAPYTDVMKLAKEAVSELGLYPTDPSNPYRIEGKKTVSLEIWEQLGRRAPDWILHSIAGGVAVFAGLAGWMMLFRLGLITKLPRMVGAQAEAVAPVVQAFLVGSAETKAVESRATVAESIAIAQVPQDASTRTLSALRQTNGQAVAVSEEMILLAQDCLAKSGGVFVEPSAAVALAAAGRLRETGHIQEGDTVVCILSGSGFKQRFPQQDQAFAEIIDIGPSLSELEQRIKGW